MCKLHNKWEQSGIYSPLHRETRNDIIIPKGVDHMKDFPVFTTDFGISSLVLREIPYRKEAYIHIQDVQPDGFDEHLRECVSFCRMAGAERIYAGGHALLEDYPLYTTVYEMHGTARVDLEKLENLFPVTEETVSRWRGIMNEKLRSVDNAATLSSSDEKRILESGGAYFVHNNGDLLGVGWMEDTRLLLVAAVKPGAGERVMHSLMSLAEGADMTLEVASTNTRAICLYEKLGFLKTRKILRWYRVYAACE